MLLEDFGSIHVGAKHIRQIYLQELQYIFAGEEYLLGEDELSNLTRFLLVYTKY